MSDCTSEQLSSHTQRLSKATNHQHTNQLIIASLKSRSRGGIFVFCDSHSQTFQICYRTICDVAMVVRSRHWNRRHSGRSDSMPRDESFKWHMCSAIWNPAGNYILCWAPPKYIRSIKSWIFLRRHCKDQERHFRFVDKVEMVFSESSNIWKPNRQVPAFPRRHIDFGIFPHSSLMICPSLYLLIITTLS